MRVDLHVHSRFSRHPSQWFLKKIGCPESFTDPLKIYQNARRSGMSLVTIADHNTIEGALEIAHLPDTFISEEDHSLLSRGPLQSACAGLRHLRGAAPGMPAAALQPLRTGGLSQPGRDLQRHCPPAVCRE